MSSWILGISSQTGNLLNGLREWVNEWYGSCDTRRDNSKLSYYEKFLEDLQHWNIESENSLLNVTLKVQVQTLKLQVRYILPYTTCCLVPEDKAYDETKRRFRIKNRPKGLVEFIVYVIQQIHLVKPDCTGFYRGSLIGECNWSKFTDCVLDNLKYVQSLDDNLVCYPKEQLKHIEESLRFVRYFVKHFGNSATTKAKIHDIYERMGSASRAAALVFELFKVGNFDGSDAEEVKMNLSMVQEAFYGCELRVKEAYFEIFAGMKLCLPDTCPLTSETLHCLIDSLLNVLHEVSTYLQLARNSREGEIRDMIKEIEFLKRILKGSLDDLVDHGKLDALATHIDVLACEAESAVYAFVGELEEMEDCETMAKILSLFAKIKRIKHEIRLSNKKDEIFIHCFIKDFLNSMRSLHATIFVPAERADGLEHPVVLELRFLQAFLRCTQKWCINHPRLQAIRIRTESMVRQTWWHIRCLSFKKNTISEKVAIDKIEFLLSYMVQQLILDRPEVIEICTKIRDSVPSSPCRLCNKFGLSFADAQCEFPKNSFSENKETGSELAVFFECLYRIAGNLLIDRKRPNGPLTFLEDLMDRKGPNGLLTFLEDLMDRGACLSYLKLVGETNEVTSLKELMKEIEDPGVSMFFYRTIASPLLNLPSAMLPPDVQMLASAKFVIRFCNALLQFNDGIVNSMIDYAADVLRDLILVKCILADPLNQYFEQEELDKLLNDIGGAVVEAGVFLFFARIDKSKVNIFFTVEDVVRCFRASVSELYSKFSKLSPSKLPVSERGSLEILLWNLTRLIKATRESTGFPLGQIQELQNGLQNCNSFLGHTTLKQDEEGMTKRLRARIMSIGCQVESSVNTFDDVPLWFFKMRVSDFTEEVKFIEEEIREVGLKPLPDGSSSDKIISQVVGTGPKAQDEVIGFENEEEGLVRQLTTNSQLVHVISIVGMPGSGKTTLAMKVYETVARSFHCSAWCYVSQNYQKKGLLQQIINDIEGPREDTKDLSEEDLAQKLYQILMKKKDYLIVLDDVWDTKVWNQLRVCFPRSNNRNKILLTSRSKIVGLHAATSDDSCIGLNLISQEKSRLLLEKSVFCGKSFPEHLRDIGMEIADKCGGLPLSLVLIAGVLKNIEEKEQQWEKVSKNLNSLVKNQDDILDKLELSYKHLPIHLKQCFLYCGALVSAPIRRGKIRRSKLVSLWVAERLIEETGENQSVEEVAESCLMDLISRSLLIVVKRGTDGRVRTCRVHDLLRDFCIWKGHEEQFLLTRIDTLKAFPNWPRRICICLHRLVEVKYPLWSKPRINTLIHSECNVACICVKYGKISHILARFRLLNVLDLESANMGDTFPESITEMTMLRYLAVCSLMHSMISIPSSIINLTNLETLIVKGKNNGVKVPDTIFGLEKLRHLVVTPYTHFFCKSFNSSDCLQLETLETVIFCCCDECQDTIPRLKRLRKLKCILFETIKNDGIPHLDSLDCLEYLKAQFSSEAPSLGKFRLPNLPASLKKITLSGFKLGWSEMGSIADLPHLEYLKLHCGAFKGNEWETEYEFPSLRYLKLDNLDIQEWIASEDHFPCLEWLVVRGCKQLKVLPPEFSDIATLKCIEVDQCCRSVADSAIEIQEKQRKYLGNKEFKSIIGLTTEEMVHDGEPTNTDKFSRIISSLVQYDFYEAQNELTHF